MQTDAILMRCLLSHTMCTVISETARGRWGGHVVRWCLVNFQFRGVLLIWIILGHRPTALGVGAGGGCFVSRLSFVFSLSLSLARYRLKYCLKGPLNPKQPTNVADSLGAGGHP